MGNQRLKDVSCGLGKLINSKNEIILFEPEGRMISLPVMVKGETVWLNRNQLSELFERDIKRLVSILIMP